MCFYWRVLYYLIFILLNFFLKKSSTLQCLDETNLPVDWYLAYKIPKISHNTNLLGSGEAYIYITSKNYSHWQLSKISVNNSMSLFGKTLSPFYSDFSSNISYIFYNDQPPYGSSNQGKGHTKGVVLANHEEGLWLVHSVPHFPKIGTNYSYPSTGTHYGQSFLCMSLNLAQLDNVGIQLQYNEPKIYAQNIPLLFRSKYPNLIKAAENITVKKAPWFRHVTITSSGGNSFFSFAKSKHFGKELYEDWVAPALQTDLYVETWPNGRGRLPSNCSKPFKVYNIESVSIREANVSFKTTHDHSKWAVSTPTTNLNWICVGDINRMEEQKKRGGGTICFKNKVVSSDYEKLIGSIEQCH